MISSFTIPLELGSYVFPNSNVLIDRLEGTGIPAPKKAIHNYSLRTGGIFISQFYEPRVMVIGGIVLANTLAAFATARRTLESAFAFNNALKRLLFTTDDSQTLYIDVMPNSEFRISPTPATIGWAKWEIELLAPDPVAYSQTLYSASGGITVFGGGTAVPTAVPLSLAGGLIGASNVVNLGSARIFVESMRIVGPGTNFTIANHALNLSLSYNGTLGVNDYIDLNFKNRTALLNGETNVYANITGDWFELAPGANSITLTAGSGSTIATALIITWRDGYLGI